MKDIRPLLESERAFEQQFASEAAREGEGGPGWSPGLLFFHISRWRERLRDGLRQLRDGRPVTRPPEEIDAFNDRELVEGAGVSMEEATKRSNAAAHELIELWREVGDRPLKWYIASTTGEAIIRNSYFHPRNHIGEHIAERGDKSEAARVFEQTVVELRKIDVPGHTLGPALCNLAGARVGQGHHDEALRLLEEGIPLRPDLAGLIAKEADFAVLKNDPRFRALL